METSILKHSKVLMAAAMVIFLAATSCGQKSESSKDTAQKTEVKAPKMDIHKAVVRGDLAIVQQHIAAGTDINAKEPMGGSTPLMSAITFHKADIVKALIAAKADLSIQNNDGSTALHSAAFFGKVEFVQWLLDAKADKSIKNKMGFTAREIVMGDFAQVKPIYDMLIMQLKPMGFSLDLTEVEKARPVVAVMLQ